MPTHQHKTEPKKRLKHAAKRVYRHAKDHVVPHEGNGYVPHALKHRVLLGYSVILILVKVLAVAAPIALPSASLYSSSITPENIVTLTNATRKSLGLPELETDGRLAAAAFAKASDMVSSQYFAHTSPTGVKPWNWILDAGYRYKAAGENLAIHFTSAEDVEAGWMASPSHRANIVDTRFTQIGVGVVQGLFEGYPSTVVVQMFGKPLAAANSTVAAQPSAPAVAAPAVATGTTVSVTATGTVAAVSSSPVVAALAPAPEEVVAKVLPTADGYKVTVKDDSIVSASLQLGASATPLRSVGEGEWQADLSVDRTVVDRNGENLSLVAVTSGTPSQIIEPIAWIAPTDKPNDLFTFSEPKGSLTVFGFDSVSGFEDGVKRFYVIAMVLLAGALLVSVLVKVRVQRPTVIGHTVFVLLLACLLMFV